MRTILTLTVAFGLLISSSSRGEGQEPPASNMDKSRDAAKVGEEATTTSVDLLVQKLKRGDEGERFASILALKKLGSKAQSAIPALTETSKKDPEPELRELAKKCLDAVNQSIVAEIQAAYDEYHRNHRGLPLNRSGEQSVSTVNEAIPSSHVSQDPLREILDDIPSPANSPQRQNPSQEEIKGKGFDLWDNDSLRVPRTSEDILRAIEQDTSWLKPSALDIARKMAGGDLYSLTNIHNPKSSPGPINFLYRWGNGPWKMVHLKPGFHQSLAHKYKFINEHKAPILEIQFDRDGDPLRTELVIVHPKRFGSPTIDVRFGAQYEFVRPEPGSRFVVLNPK